MKRSHTTAYPPGGFELWPWRSAFAPIVIAGGFYEMASIGVIVDYHGEWNLGFFGELAWKYLAESRELIRELIDSQVARAILDEERPRPVEQFEVLIHAVSPLVRDRLGLIDLGDDFHRRFARFLREALEYSGPYEDDVKDHLHSYIIENVGPEELVSVVHRYDPDLVDLFKQRYTGIWD